MTSAAAEPMKAAEAVRISGQCCRTSNEVIRLKG